MKNQSNVAKRSSLLGSPTGDLVLRVDGDDARLLRTSAVKCSIGSALDCTIQLSDASVRDVHCLILRGEHRTVVRRWAEDARLNDTTFVDAPLCKGDRLDIGSVRLEVLCDGTPTDDTGHGDFDTAGAEASSYRVLSRPRSEGDSSSFCPPLDVRRIGHHRVRRLVKQLRDYQGRLRQLQCQLERQDERNAFVAEQQQAELELAQRSLQLQEQTEQLKRDRESLEFERESWHQMQSRYDSESAKRTEELTARVEQFEAARQELGIEKQRTEDDLMRQLGESREERLRIEKELEIALAASGENETDAECESKQFDVGIRAMDGTEPESPIDDRLETTGESDTTASPSNLSDVDDIQFEQLSEESPVNTSEILQRLGHESPHDAERPGAPDTDCAGQGDVAAAEDVANDAAFSGDAAIDARDEPNEELSVEDYMNRLLGRTRGQSASPLASVYKPAVAESARNEKRLSSTTKADAVSPSTVSDEEYVPRTLPPELTSNLAAMRELANRSARSAIGRHVRTRWGHAAMGKFVVAFVAAISAMILWVWSAGYSSWTFLAACVAAIVAIFWALQTGVLLNQFLIALRTKEQSLPEQDESVGTGETPVNHPEFSSTASLVGVSAEPVATADVGVAVTSAPDTDANLGHVEAAR